MYLPMAADTPLPAFVEDAIREVPLSNEGSIERTNVYINRLRDAIRRAMIEAVQATIVPRVPRLKYCCLVCKVNWVDVEDGIDTCESCRRRV